MSNENSNLEGNILKSIENNKIEIKKFEKKYTGNIKQHDLSISSFNHEDIELMEQDSDKNKIGNLIINYKGKENNKHTLKKFVFEKDVIIEDKINCRPNWHLNELINIEKSHEKIFMNSKNSVNSNSINNKANKLDMPNLSNTKSSHSLNNFKNLPKIEEKILFSKHQDTTELNNEVLCNSPKREIKLKINKAYNSSNITHSIDDFNKYSINNSNYKKKGDRSKNKTSESQSIIKKNDVLLLKNKVKKFPNFKIVSDKEEKLKFNTNLDKNFDKTVNFTDKKITSSSKITLNNFDKFSISTDKKILVSPNTKILTSTEKQSKSKVYNFKNFSSAKKKKEKVPNEFMTEKKLQKFNWIDCSIIDREEKNKEEIKVDEIIEKEIKEIFESKEEITNPEVIAIYNKIFDKFYRKLFDPKAPKTKDLQDQIRRYLKLRGKPSYLDDKIKDIKTKIFFMKCIFDFSYPEIIANKLKVQKNYYELMKKEIHEAKKNKLDKVQDNFKTKSNYHDQIENSEFYSFKERAKTPNSFYPRVQTAFKSDVKKKTHTINFFKNIVKPQTSKNANNPSIIKNISENIFNLKKYDENFFMILKNHSNNEKI